MARHKSRDPRFTVYDSAARVAEQLVDCYLETQRYVRKVEEKRVRSLRRSPFPT